MRTFLDMIVIHKLPFLFSPSKLAVEITNKCNMECVFCPHQDDPNLLNDVSFHDFQKIIAKFPRLKTVDLTSYGEILLHPQVFEIIRFLKETEKSVVFVTNGTLISKNIAEKLVDLKVDVIDISFDSTKKEVFENIRHGSVFEEVVNNIKRLVRIKELYKADKPILGLLCTITDRTVEEIPALVEFAHSLGLRKMLVQPARKDGFFPSYEERIYSLLPDKEKYLRNIDIAMNKARQLSMDVTFKSFQKNVTSCRLEYDMRIAVGGQVWPCCEGWNAKNTAFGNIFSQNFRNIWTSKKFMELRKEIRKGGYPDYCKNSGVCRIFNTIS